MRKNSVASKTILKNYKILQKFLDRHFSKVETALTHKNVFELLVATIMSAQCTDVLVNKVTPKLFKKYKSSRDFGNAKISALQKDIYPVTFYRNKAKAIKKTAQIINAKYNGKVPKTLEELIDLPGVARKTANAVLGNGFGIAEGIVVDTHVRRVSNRFGLSKNSDPKKIEHDLMQIVPKKNWIKFSNQTIWFGRKICKARGNQCQNFPELKKICLEKSF